MYYRTVFAVCVAIAGLGAGHLRGEVLDFAAHMTPECAGLTASTSGWGSFTFDTETSELAGHLGFDPALASTYVNMHSFPDPCENVPNGPVVIIYPNATPTSGTVILTLEFADDLLSGELYAMVHSVPFPAGEIAGILKPVPTNRYLSFMPAVMTASSVAATQAIRVRLTSLHHPDPPTLGSPDFSAFEGEFRWVGLPETMNDPLGGSNPTFDRSMLETTPVFRDWSDVPFMLHATGSEVVPSSVYELQFVDDTCSDLNDPLCYSDPIVVRTSRWGDVIAPFAEYVGDGQPNFADITQILDKFKSFASAKTLPRMDIAGTSSVGSPNVPDAWIGFHDISMCVDAFKGSPYPYTLN